MQQLPFDSPAKTGSQRGRQQRWDVDTAPCRRRYPSDLHDETWAAIAGLLGITGPRATVVRELADAISYRWTTGCPWRMLPHDFPPWCTVYAQFLRWRAQGVLSTIQGVMLRPRRRYGADGRPHRDEERQPALVWETEHTDRSSSRNPEPEPGNYAAAIRQPPGRTRRSGDDRIRRSGT